MPALTLRRGLPARKRSSNTYRRMLHGELLEARWALSWGGAPPTSVTLPTSAPAVTLSSQNDATGVASIASTEVDYFSFTATATGSYVLSATTPSSNVDTVLGLFASTGARLAYNDDISNSNRDSRVTVNLTAGTRYYIGITNYSGTSGGSYTWTIDGPAPTTTPTDDSFENNDSFAAASSLGTRTIATTISGLVMADSSDYFRFTTTAAGTSANSVSISFQNSQGDLDLELYNSAGTLVSRSQGTGNVEQLSLSGLAAGNYTARVYGYQGATNANYSLSLAPPTTTPPPPTPTIDLAGAGLSVSNATAWGQTVTASASVRNSGNTAAGAFSEQWYLSRDAVGSSDDILLSRTGGAGTSYGVSSLGAGSTSSTFNVTLQLPSALPSGWTGTSFFLVMRTDAAAQVGETNENNNFGQAGSGLDTTPITIGGTTQSGGFQIQLSMSGLTASQQTIFNQAADRWEEVIIGDLPNATYNGQTVDDLLIHASSASIDGVGGVLGQAGPDRFRSGSSLPYHGSMEFDSADLLDMQQDGSLLDVVMHEIGHILGIGTIWEDLGLLTGAGTSNPLFTGSQAVAAYNQIFGTNASGVPVQNSGGSGTRDSHWRDSILGNEMMTGYAGPGTDLPLSRITVGSLADLGYVVNMNAADPYTRPGLSNVVAGSTSARSSSTSLQAATETSAGITASECASATAVELSGRRSYVASIDAFMAAYAAAGEHDLRRLRA